MKRDTRRQGISESLTELVLLQSKATAVGDREGVHLFGIAHQKISALMEAEPEKCRHIFDNLTESWVRDCDGKACKICRVWDERKGEWVNDMWCSCGRKIEIQELV